MEIDIVEQKENNLVFHIRGAGHTFCNSLKDIMVDMDDVDVVTYTIEHPLVADPKFFLETDGEEPTTVLKQAVDELVAMNKKVLEEVSSLDV